MKYSESTPKCLADLKKAAYFQLLFQDTQRRYNINSLKWDEIGLYYDNTLVGYVFNGKKKGFFTVRRNVSGLLMSIDIEYKHVICYSIKEDKEISPKGRQILTWLRDNSPYK